MAESKVWFITGASTGFGRRTTEHLLSRGHRVVATLRRPEVLADLTARYPTDRLIAVRLDVTKHAEIPAAFSKAKEAFGRVDVVFNNAGKLINGEIESINNEDARDLFEINFWGAIQVTREAVRFFRDDNQPQGGRLLQMSSAVGVIGRPFFGYYSASKCALEGLTEALADELDPAWNIKVTIVEPGPFLTEIFTQNTHVAPPHPAYANPELKVSKWRAVFSASFPDGDPDKASIAFEKVSQLENPPLRLPLHRIVLALLNEKGKKLLEAAETYKDWSDDIYL